MPPKEFLPVRAHPPADEGGARRGRPPPGPRRAYPTRRTRPAQGPRVGEPRHPPPPADLGGIEPLAPKVYPLDAHVDADAPAPGKEGAVVALAPPPPAECPGNGPNPGSSTPLRPHQTALELVCRLPLEKNKTKSL